MAAGKCDLCEKKVVFGRHIRYAHGGNWERKAQKKNRMFKPNVQAKKMFIGGKWQRVNACTRCMRTELKRIQASGVPYPVSVAAP